MDFGSLWKSLNVNYYFVQFGDINNNINDKEGWSMLNLTKRLKGKINDFVIAGALGGFVGAIPMDLSNLLSWHLKIADYTLAQFAVSAITGKWKSKEKKYLIFGEIYHLAFETLAGIPLSLLFKKSGTKHHLIKGLGMGLFMWAIPFQLVMRFGFHNIKPRSFKGQYSALFNQLLWGVTAAHTMVTLAGPRVFPKIVLEDEVKGYE